MSTGNDLFATTQTRSHKGRSWECGNDVLDFTLIQLKTLELHFPQPITRHSFFVVYCRRHNQGLHSENKNLLFWSETNVSYCFRPKYLLFNSQIAKGGLEYSSIVFHQRKNLGSDLEKLKYVLSSQFFPWGRVWYFLFSIENVHK